MADDDTKSSVDLHYAVFVHDFHVLDADGAYGLRPWGYGGSARLYTIGLASWFLTVNIAAHVEGRFENGKVLPIFYDSTGLSRGKQRHVHLTFDQNGPHVESLTPHDDDRDPLPDAQLKNAVDILSGLGLLFHTLETTGKCRLSGNIFDGLRLTRIDSQGPFTDIIPDEHDNYYKGSAQRCDFTGRQIAGFVVHSHHRDLLSAPQPGQAWFQHIGGIGIIPVRIDFHHPKLGKIVMILQEPATHATVTADLPSDTSQKIMDRPLAESDR